MSRQVYIQNQNHPLERPLTAIYCESFFSRLRGFTFRHHLALEEGLILVQERASRLDASIHMLAVFTDLAVFWLDETGSVVDTVRAKAWRLAYIPKRPAKFVLEIHPDRADEFQIGDKVTFTDV
jgi:uncharacterized membrane protein (UPF0127 family)